MSDEWDFKAISLPPGCWVHSISGDLMLPSGTVIGKLNEGGIDALKDYLFDARAAPGGQAMTEIERVLYATMDPEVTIDGKPVPALTTLLHRVCGSDEEKFHEATYIVELFIAEALKARAALGAKP